MKRVLIALMIAILGVAMFGASANAGGPEQRGRERAGKLLQRGGERVRQVAALLEMTPREILSELRQGETIEALAAEKGVPLSDIEAALSQPYEERIANAVTDGVLSQEQADYLLTQANERLHDFLTLSPRRALREPMLEDLATVLDMSEEEIVAQIQAGSTPAEIVAASGQSADSVIAEMVALKDADLTERVRLDLMTETQKNRIVRGYEQILTHRLGG